MDGGKQVVTPIGWCRSFVSTLTLERAGIIGTLAFGAIAIGVQFYQIRDLALSQKESDIRQAELANNVARVGEVLESFKRSEFQPHPYIEAPLETIKLTPNESIFNEAGIRVRNVGRGNCYSLHVSVRYDEVKFYDEKGKSVGNQPIGAAPVTVIDSITLAAGHSQPVLNVPYPLSDSTAPQTITGLVQLFCEDGAGQPHYFVQPFAVVVHMEAKNPHAHLAFNSTQELTGPDFIARLPNGKAVKLDISPDDIKRPQLGTLFPNKNLTPRAGIKPSAN